MKLCTGIGCIYEIEIWIASNKQIMNATGNTQVRNLAKLVIV